MTINERISSLRTLMEQKGIHAYIIPSEDPHGSEYVHPHWQSRKWISGFTGSAGTMVVTKDKAFLWTDFRYYIQAEDELKGSEIELFKYGIEGVPNFDKWIADNMKEGQVIGINGMNFSSTKADQLELLFKKNKIVLKSDNSLIDTIWDKDRPLLPHGEVFLHDEKYHGLNRSDKLIKIRALLKELKASDHLLTSLEDIAWLFNLRGNDIETIPVFFSYALISMEKVQLFVHKNKISKAVENELKKDSIEILPYDNVFSSLSNLDKNTKILVDKEKTNKKILKSINSSAEIINDKNPTIYLKSIKNEIEISNFRKVMELDGIALVRFFKWLEENLLEIEHSELSLAEKLRQFRAMNEEFKGESFTPIPGYRAHGAMCHYSANEKSQYKIDKNGGLFLIDSGGQYPGGTTDITRTLTLGNRTNEEIRDYTLVLKGHIALSMAQFPLGTRGYQLDILARMAMWKDGIDFGHGTGHGVGSYLSVHEGPMSISPRAIDVPLKPGMIISNEPGIYREGSHGIRIENLILVKKEKETEFGSFYNFETLTLCPYDYSLIDTQLLTHEELSWLNSYNEQVFSKLSPYLDSEEKEWLKEKTIAHN